MGTYQLGRRLVAASGVVEAHLGSVDGRWVTLSRLASPWSLDSTFVERFVQHSKGLAANPAQGVAPLIEFGHGGDGFWFAEATDDGEPLRALMSSTVGRLSVLEAASAAERIGQALAALHARSHTLHGDIAASSVFVTHSGEVHLLHPQVAVIAGSHPSRGPARSEPHAVAPEEVSGPATPASEVFRLGLLFLEMLTGRSLFVAPDPLQVLATAARYQGLQPSAVQGVPEQLASLLGWLMHRDPAQRPSSADAVSALQLACDGLELTTSAEALTTAFRRLTADRQPPMGARMTELRLDAPRAATPPPPVARPSAPGPQPSSVVIGRMGTRKITLETLELEKVEREAARGPPPAGLMSNPATRDAMVAEQLIKVGLLTPELIQAGLQRAAMQNLSLGDTLLFDGVVTEDQLVAALAAITRTPFVTSAELAQLQADAVPIAILPGPEAERLTALPLAVKGQVLVVAVVDPFDGAVLDEIKEVTCHPALRVVRAGDRALRDAITRLYGGVTDDDPDSWLDRGPSTHSSNSGLTSDTTQPLELIDDGRLLELEGRAAVRARSVSVTGLDEGQMKLVELLLQGLGEAGQQGVSVVQLVGEVARRLNASTSEIDKARFVASAVVAHNVLSRRGPWEVPQQPRFDEHLGPLALPVKGLVPGLFDGLKAMPEDLVGLSVVTVFAFALTAGGPRRAEWQAAVAVLRGKRFSSVALEALVKALEA